MKASQDDVDMPQKLRNLDDSISPGKVDLSPDAIAQNGQLAAIAMYAINLASYLDTMLALVFAEITDDNATTTIAMLNALAGEQPKIAIINAAVNNLLPTKERELFGAILTIAKGSLKERNMLAHGLWGIYKSLPDILILLEPIHFVTPNAKIKEQFAKGTLSDIEGAERFQVFVENAYAYGMKDFDNIVRRMQFAINVSDRFHLMLQSPEPLKSALRRELEALPQIQSILSRE